MRHYICKVLVTIWPDEEKEFSEESDMTLLLATKVNHDHLSDIRNVSLVSYQEVDKKDFNDHVYAIFDEFGGI